MKTFKLSLVLRTRENTDIFISLDDNIYGIHSERINILYKCSNTLWFKIKALTALVGRLSLGVGRENGSERGLKTGFI